MRYIVFRHNLEVVQLSSSGDLTPLTEASYYILISLLQPLHGYAVMQKVQAMSGGRVRLGPGTLYGALSNLHSAGLIEPVGAAGAKDRRKTYVITQRGRQIIESEIARLEEMIAHGKAMLADGGAHGGR